MPLSRLENFLVNTDGNILYVNPSDLDATDSFDNKGNSLTRPFVTIQRALIESARFAYQSGKNNDKFDRTTILLYPGEHLIDNRPGLYINVSNSVVQYRDQNGTVTPDLKLDNGSIFNLNDINNLLYKFNSVHGGVIVPKGTSIVGLDLRKTKVRPLYVPNPDVDDTVIPRSALFRVTGGCYFWQFSMFDANRSVYYSKTFSEKRNPNISHHKLTCFEYADGLNEVIVNGETFPTDLQQYYFKLMNAYGTSTGNRNIIDYPQNDGKGDFEPNTPETKIVGDLASDDNKITELTSNLLQATVTTEFKHGLTVDDQILITGVGTTDLYNGTYRVTGIRSDRQFTYNLNADANDDVVNLALNPKAQITIEADTVTGASPYIFNCSLRSVFGMCGLHADGSKATGFKSMVVAQFTGIGLQKDDKAFVIYKNSTGDYLNSVDATLDPDIDTPLYINPKSQYRKRYDNFHIKVSNDAFIQAVSVFAIGFSNHFLAESGGEQSITNSNSNFGNKALVSKGFKANSFKRDDTGYVTHIVPPKDLEKEETNIIWRILDPIKTKFVGISSHLYIKDEKDITNPPSNVVNGFRIGAKKDDKLFLNVNINLQDIIYSSPILMPVASGDGPSAEKKFTVDRTASGNNISSKEITLTENHNFLPGESVRIFADNGRTPDGIEIGKKYFVILGSANNKIKLANTQSDALAEVTAPDEINTRGGILTVQSTVTDKIPGEIGHPIQFDGNNVTYTRDGVSVTEVGGWYILGSFDATNEIYNGFTGTTNSVDNSVTIDKNNSSTYVQRRSESRALDDRIYRLRYVIPKDFEGANIAKKPEKNYVLQESSTVGEDAAIVDVTSNRNPRIIANATITNNVATITTEKPHKLSVNDKVKIKNVISSTNLTGVGNTGYNGLFTVTGTPSSKTFEYSNQKIAGTYTDITSDARAGTNNRKLANLPVLERVEYDTSYTIQEVETIQEYISKQQDGVFYLTCLIGNVSPTVSEFSDSRYKQNSVNLYPTVDKDNPNNDPVQSVSSASNKTLGKVDVNNPLNSITKEFTINYLRDNRIGFAVTFAESNTAGITTLTSNVEHNLNSIRSLSNPSGTNTGYAGVSTTLFNVELVNNSNPSADGATGNVEVNGSGSVTAVEIVDGGSGYNINDVLTVGTGNATVSVASINNAVGNVIQVVGVGTITNRTNGGYNGLYKITSVPSSKKVTYTHVAKGETTGSTVGVYTGPVGTTSGIFTLLDEKIGISQIDGVAGTNLPGTVTVTTSVDHNLAVGNKIKIAGITGATEAAVYNGFDFIVKEIIATDKFTMNSTLAIPVTGEAGAELYKYGLNSFGQDNSLASEKIAGSLSPLLTGIDSKLLSDTSAAGTGNPATSTIAITSTLGISAGDFLQIGNEIVRVKAKNSTNPSQQMEVFRGVLGTQSAEHKTNDLVRKINVIPSELHRFSAIRASGHTFEYIGYGPGNYSTSLPQKIKKQIETEEEILAISREEDGGIVFFSGMNDRGDFFSGQRAEPKELFLGETGDSNSAIFDDLFVRNTLRVGGGPNQNLPSEFNGPVNFSSKVTSTSLDGIEAIKLLIKGNSLNKPSFQVGDDSNPSLLVDKETQNVGIRNASPQHELDVNGTIRANVYENFKLSDLPDATEETTFARNRIIKVKEDGSGYEMIDPHELEAYELRSLGVSNDGSVYAGDGVIDNNKLKITGITTDRFFVDERVKIFGVTKTTDNVTIDTPVQGISVKVQRVKEATKAEAKTYYYWQAQYHLRNGKVGISSQIDPTGNYVGPIDTARDGVKNVDLEDFNDINYNVLTLSRTNEDHGLLIYRQNFNGSGTAANAKLGDAKLIAVLGQKELGSSTEQITWKDFGVYEQPFWSPKGTDNEFLGFSTSTTKTHQIHFPTIGTEGQRRGWDIDKIVSIGQDSITVEGNYNLNNMDGITGFGTDTKVRVVHDNTKSISDAVARITDAGGNYLNLPSGTYITNKIIVPTEFSLRGNGKNTIIKKQYYATDENSVGTGGASETAIVNGKGDPAFDGVLVGIGTTNANDVTIADITIDGNSSNNLMFESDEENNLVLFEGGTSILFKDMEIRNSAGGGLYARNSRRVSIENSTIVDGGLTDRYNIRPLDVQNSETVRINDCLFENFAGAIDVSVTTVTATGGNIIRNCGSGIDAYATGKITTTNNVILGPADEFIASPDIYDTDFDSINITIKTSDDFTGPELLYIENGEPKDLSSSAITLSAGIGTMVGLFSTTRTASLGPIMFPLKPVTADEIDDGIERETGFIRVRMSKAQFSQDFNGHVLTEYVGSSTALGYEIIGTEYLDKPIGLSTFVGITSGYWANGAGYGAANGGYVDPSNVGVAVTQYVVKIEDTNQFSYILEGDFVKLTGHSMSPDLAGGVNSTLGYTDETGGAITTANGLRVDKKLPLDRLVLTGFTIPSGTIRTNGEQPKVGDYISIRRVFTIAKGRVGVT